MNGKTTFTKFQVDNLNQPLLYKLSKLKRNLNRNFKYYDIRKIDVDYDKHKNFFKYMKELAYLKYRRSHLVKIFCKNYFDIFTQKELNNIKRRKSHKNPYHIKTYHRLIYRNLYNYQYKPYVLPLQKEDKINKLNLTDTLNKKRKTTKKAFVNPYLDKKIKYLTKVNQRLMNQNLKNYKNNSKKIESNLFKSNSMPMINNRNIKNLKKNESLPKITQKKLNFKSLDNDNNLYEKNEENKTIIKPLKINVNKKRILILPKIKDDCLSTIDYSKKIERDLRIFKYGKKETSKKEKEEENIDESNLLNVPPRKLYKLFFGIKKQPKKIDITKEKKINKSSNKKKKDKSISSINIKNNMSAPVVDNNYNCSKDVNEIKIEKENINDISVIKENNNSNKLNEDFISDKKIFNFEDNK